MKLIPVDYNGGQIWVTPIDSNPVGKTVIYTLTNEVFVYVNGNGYETDTDFIIVGQSPNLSLPNIPYVEIEEDIDDTVSMSDALETIDVGYRSRDFESGFEQGWKERGYKAASAKKYTEEDLRKVWYIAKLKNVIGGFPTVNSTLKEVMESLQHRKPVSIEIEERAVNYRGSHPIVGGRVYERFEPITYQKDDKIFLKIKQVNYE